MGKKLFRVTYAMNFLMQAIFCLILPAGLLIGGGWWLRERFGLGNWVMILGIVLGVLWGVYDFFRLLLKTAQHISREEKKGDGGNA